MKRYLIACLLGLGLMHGRVLAQLQGPTEEDAAWRFAQTITADEIRAHLEVLASDAFEGRETGTEGQRKAAAWIEQYFRGLGLPPVVGDTAWQQPIRFTSERLVEASLRTGDKEWRHLYDFYAWPAAMPAGRHEIAADEVVFAGYGIDAPAWSDYAGRDVEGKVVLIYQGEPFDRQGRSRVTGSEQPSRWAGDWKLKIATARRHGARAVLLVEPQVRKQVLAAGSRLFRPATFMGDGSAADDQYLPHAFVSASVVRALLGKHMKKVVKARKRIERKGKPALVAVPVRLQLLLDKTRSTLTGSNVLGYIEGTDPALKDELIIISAHYDHLGKHGGAIYNGADDNGSGTSTVLEIAQAFAEARKAGAGPRRSVLCLLVSGEEKGLLGSQYYVHHPVFPLEHTVADINIDMIGRVDKAHADDPNYVYVIGADRLSSELHQINEAMNARYTHLQLDYTYNAEDDPNRYYYRSDHYNFAERGIPAVFFFSGVHDDYHQPTDTVDKILFDKMVPIARLAFLTAWELANRDARIRVDKGKASMR